MKEVDIKKVTWIPLSVAGLIKTYADQIADPKRSEFSYQALSRMLDPAYRGYMTIACDTLISLGDEEQLLEYFDRVCELISDLDVYDPASWRTYKKWLSDVENASTKLAKLFREGPQSPDIAIPDGLRICSSLFQETIATFGNEQAAVRTTEAIAKVSRTNQNIPISFMLSTLASLAESQKDCSHRHYYWEEYWATKATPTLGDHNQKFRDFYVVLVLKKLTKSRYKSFYHDMVANLANVITVQGQWDVDDVRKLNSKIFTKISQ